MVNWANEITCNVADLTVSFQPFGSEFACGEGQARFKHFRYRPLDD